MGKGKGGDASGGNPNHAAPEVTQFVSNDSF